MKLRITINNNADEYVAAVYEDNNKIIVIKQLTANHFDNSTDEKFEFNSVKDYELWLENQDWIIKKKIKKICSFQKVKEA